MGREIPYVDARLTARSSPRKRGPGVLAALALLATGAAHAAPDTLETVRDALRQLNGHAPISATLERAVTIERKDRPLEAGRATLRIAAGADGISVAYPPSVLEPLRRERADTDPENPKPMRQTLQDFDAIDVADMLNGAPGLLSDLEGATLKGDTAVELEGRPARLLELDLVLRVSKADSKWVKRANRSMKLWVTPDGMPLATERQGEYVVGLLIFTFDAREARSESYARTGDRLVTLRRTMNFDGEGFGESQHTYSETTLRLQTGSNGP